MDVEAEKRSWLSGLRPAPGWELFDFLPNTLFFAKDAKLRLMAGNRAFYERCGFTSEDEMIGRTDRDIFPPELAEKYRADDLLVLERGAPLVGINELFPNRLGEPEWFITDKMPLRDAGGNVTGVCGTVRSYEGARANLQPFLELAPVTDHLKKNYAEKISVADLAAMAGMSLRKLERRFQQTFKTTPQRYVLKLRVLAACDLLAQTNLSVTDVALRVGFCDHSAFSKRFSSMLGMSPRDYRKRFERS